MRDSVVFYRSFYDALKELPAEDQVQCFHAIMEYGLDEKEPDCTGLGKAIFSLIKPQIDANNRRYENGSKGGRPKTEKEPRNNLDVTETKPKGNLIITEVEPKEKVKDKEKVKENDLKSFAVSSGMSFPLNDGSLYDIPENDVVRYQQLYPALDIRQELRNIIAWCEANPKNRKTRSGAKRFVNSWLSRSQNSARPDQKPKKVNQFNNFPQREYSQGQMQSMEQRLLAKKRGGSG